MKRTIGLKLNGRDVTLHADDERALLWVLRTDFALTGTKYGCGEGLLRRLYRDGRGPGGALVPDASEEGGGQGVLRLKGSRQRRIASAAASIHRARCISMRLCTSGMLLCAAAFLREVPNPSREAIVLPHGRQPVPLRRASRSFRHESDFSACRRSREDWTELGRREFFEISSAACRDALGLRPVAALPQDPNRLNPQDYTPIWQSAERPGRGVSGKMKMGQAY